MQLCRILVVEDEAIVAMDIEDRLASMNYALAGRADSGEKALDLIEKQHPDLVLMDIRLKGDMDGITAAEEVRRRFHLPVIFLTAYSEDATVERAKLAEPYGYILKPFEDRELKSAIEIALYKHQAESEIRRLNRLYDVLSQVNQAIVRIDTREELLPSICRMVVERGEIDLAWIGLVDEKTLAIRPVASFRKEDGFQDGTDFFAGNKSLGRGAPARAVQKGAPVICNRCGPDVCFTPVASEFGFQSCGAFPLRFQGEVCGTLNLCTTEPGFFREREIKLLEEVAMDISFALDKIEGAARRQRAESGMQRQNQVLAGINGILRGTLASCSEQGLAQICLDAAQEMTGSRFGFLGEIDESGRFADIAISGSGWEACKMTGSPGHRAMPTELKVNGIYGRVLRDGKGFFTNDPSSHPDSIGFPPEHPGVESFLGVPLVRDGRIVGVVCMGNREGGYTSAELESLEAMVPTMVEALLRKRAEQELRDREERLRLFIEHAPASLAMFDRGMRYLSASRRWRRDYGLGDLDLVGLSHYEIFPEITENWRAVHRRALAGEVVRAQADRFDRADGSVQWLNWEVRPWHDLKGNVAGIVIFSEDITRRKQAEDALREGEERFHRAMEASTWALRESEARFRSYIDRAPLAVLIADRDGHFLNANPAAIDLLGYDADSFARMHITDIHPMEDRELVLRDFETLVREGSFEAEHRMVKRNGQVIWVLLNVVMLDDQQSLAYLRDITAQRRAEEEKARTEAQLRQAQKMEALGTLAGGIAHDFNNILGVIIGYTEMAQMETDEGSSPQSSFQEVLKAANRAKDLVKQILAFSRQGEQEKRPVQVGLITNEALKMLRASLPSTIEIQKDVQSKAAVMADPTQIHQVLMNLCTNAAHAMRREGGILSVSLQDVRIEQDFIAPNSELLYGTYVRLTVKDTGHGIAPSILDRIFDPFFTTKKQGVGTGLGLSVVHGIVKRHGGAIEVESVPGQGTSFHVFFPAMEAAVEKPVVQAGALPGGSERILVVDDEPGLAKTTMQMLERLGYRVEFRTNGADALEAVRARAHENRFDLVITDMTMPHLTGADLARELFKLDPQLAVVLCTGFSERMDPEKAQKLGIQGFLMKPFALRDLAEMVRKVLDENQKRMY